MNDRDKHISRREFLNRLTMLSALALSYPPEALAVLRNASAASRERDWLATDPWKTLAAVQEHLFPPTDEAPGASDIHAIDYLHKALENPAADGEDKEFIVNGVGWLNELTQEQFKRPFTALDEQQRETVLRRIEQSRAGRNWLSLMLTYLIEALLSDPVYGGNPGGIGWRWLEHQPGFPTPPDDKLWFKLASRVHYRRKAQ
jgi:gluconate 2-dehydrogenase gamma chain